MERATIKIVRDKLGWLHQLEVGKFRRVVFLFSMAGAWTMIDARTGCEFYHPTGVYTREQLLHETKKHILLVGSEFLMDLWQMNEKAFGVPNPQIYFREG